MREIKFRGKVADTGLCALHAGEWVYGSLVLVPDNPKIAIIYNTADTADEYSWEKTYVDASTVGQFIGISDDFGKEIYEGDVVEYTNREDPSIKFIAAICYDHEDCAFTLDKDPIGFWRKWWMFKVVDNIYDKPNEKPNNSNNKSK
jgi:uncharacterized phage protein (TIGR01671 family)